LFSDILDHLPIFCICFESYQTVSRKNDTITVREKKEHNLNKFKEKLTAVICLEREGFHDLNQSYQTFHSKFTQIYNTNFPIKQIKQKHHLANKPWLSKGILKSIKRKNKLYKQYLCNPAPEIESYYKRYKNTVS
jgi:hypothetical protein